MTVYTTEDDPSDMHSLIFASTELTQILAAKREVFYSLSDYELSLNSASSSTKFNVSGASLSERDLPIPGTNYSSQPCSAPPPPQTSAHTDDHVDYRADDGAFMFLLQSECPLAAIRWFLSTYQQRHGHFVPLSHQYQFRYLTGNGSTQPTTLLNKIFTIVVHIYGNVTTTSMQVHSTPLGLAAAMGSVQLTNYLLSSTFNGILDINVNSDECTSPLAIAALTSNEAVFYLLLQDQRLEVQTMMDAVEVLNNSLLRPMSPILPAAGMGGTGMEGMGGTGKADPSISPMQERNRRSRSLLERSSMSVALQEAIAGRIGGNFSSRVALINDKRPCDGAYTGPPFTGTPFTGIAHTGTPLVAPPMKELLLPQPFNVVQLSLSVKTYPIKNHIQINQSAEFQGIDEVTIVHESPPHLPLADTSTPLDMHASVQHSTGAYSDTSPGLMLITSPSLSSVGLTPVYGNSTYENPLFENPVYGTPVQKDTERHPFHSYSGISLEPDSNSDTCSTSSHITISNPLGYGRSYKAGSHNFNATWYKRNS